jgi:hypothetical protein
MAELTAGLEVAPGPGVADDDTAGLEAFARSAVTTFHHAVGTCRWAPTRARAPSSTRRAACTA